MNQYRQWNISIIKKTNIKIAYSGGIFRAMLIGLLGDFVQMTLGKKERCFACRLQADTNDLKLEKTGIWSRSSECWKGFWT